LLVGSPPFAAKGLTGLIQKVVHEDPEPLPKLRPEVPAKLWHVVQRMLAKNVAQRYKFGAQIVADLDKVLEDLKYDPVQLSEDEKITRMQTLRFFKEFSKPELKEICKIAKWERRPVEDRISTEGEHEHAFFVLADGMAEVTVDGKHIHDLEVGDCFGEMEFLNGGGRTAAVSIRRDATLIRIDQELKSWASLPCQMRFNRAFQNILIERLRNTTKALAKALR
jgi:CRP-like cAMP-binding protein